jgi:hypothetical protein
MEANDVRFSYRDCRAGIFPLDFDRDETALSIPTGTRSGMYVISALSLVGLIDVPDARVPREAGLHREEPRVILFAQALFVWAIRHSRTSRS